jgi:hypothetical protein
LLIALAAALIVRSEALAQFTFTADSAANYGGAGEPGWTNGSSAGAGFSAWSFSTGGNAGGFIGNPSSGGISGMSTESFGLYANPTNAGNFINVDRSLSTAMQVDDRLPTLRGVNIERRFAEGRPGRCCFRSAVHRVCPVSPWTATTICSPITRPSRNPFPSPEHRRRVSCFSRPAPRSSFADRRGAEVTSLSAIAVVAQRTASAFLTSPA